MEYPELYIMSQIWLPCCFIIKHYDTRCFIFNSFTEKSQARNLPLQHSSTLRRHFDWVIHRNPIVSCQLHFSLFRPRHCIYKKSGQFFFLPQPNIHHFAFIYLYVGMRQKFESCMFWFEYTHSSLVSPVFDASLRVFVLFAPSSCS